MQTIGERLEEARKRKGISIREAAEATKIRGDYLHKFESNQFDIRLPEIYVRGFLRSYAVYLKLPADKLLNSYASLGLGAEKHSRPINREIYGRMDLSVASAEKETKAPEAPLAAAAESAAGGAEPSAPAEGNPATFRPRPHAAGAGKGFAIDPNLVIKLGALIAGAVILVLLLVWIVGLFKGKPHVGGPLDAGSGITWVKPQDGQRVLSLVGSGPVTLVTVTDGANAVLYRGPLQTGQTVSVPRGGVLTIDTDEPQNLGVQIVPGGTVYPLKDPATGRFMTRSTIKAP